VSLALKYSSYGGKVCSSCRAFFRRSVQSGYHALFQCKLDKMCNIEQEVSRKCQFCRFQSCLSSGMKTTLVLSDQARNSKFNKLRKANRTIIKDETKSKHFSISMPSALYFSFSNEEQTILNNILTKMGSSGSWVQNLLMFDRESAVNVIEYTYGFAHLKKRSWETLKRSMGYSFGKDILPRFSEIAELSSHDIGQIMNSNSSGIAQCFRSCQILWMESEKDKKLASRHEKWYVASHVRCS
jgi:hypothetical protein